MLIRNSGMMHKSCFDAMSLLLNKYATSGSFLDVGSMDINGSFKPLVIDINKGSGSYTGLDIAEGKNVDIVTADPYVWPISSNCYDAVISANCIEHTTEPWTWIKEVYRVCKPGGLVIVIGPWSCWEHRHPLDCWRIFPDGMKHLLGNVAGFEVLEVGMNEGDENFKEHLTADCWGAGRKSK
jgi:SAM-dependent methyltransferase